MQREEHKKRHQELHRMLDELVADWIGHTGKLPSRATVMELMDWSAQQADFPCEDQSFDHTCVRGSDGQG